MRIDWATLALQAVNLLILVALLSRFLFRPVADLLQRRRAEAARLIGEAQAERAEAAKTRAALDAEAATLAAGRAAAVRAASEAAEAERRKLIEAAQTQAAEIVADAKAAALRERADEASLASRQAGELALDIAGKLVARLPEGTRASGFLAGLADEIAALPEASRAELATQRLKLKSPVELDAKSRAACREALSKALGGEVALDFLVDPALIAGLELEGPHARIVNTLRADLAAIRAEFARHDA